MDYPEWAPRTAPRSDPDTSDPGRTAYDPYAPTGQPAERINSRDDWPGPITGSGHPVARGDDRDAGDRGYWDERYVNRDDLGRHASHPLERPVERQAERPVVPAMRTPDDGFTSTSSWRTDGLEPLTAAPRTRDTPPAALGTFEDDDRDYPIVLTWTAIWYAVPVFVFFLWGVTRSGAPKGTCATGPDCTSARSDALHSMLHNGFGIVLALVLSLALAALVRRSSLSWRAVTLGFAASVVGAGATTLLFSAF